MFQSLYFEQADYILFFMVVIAIIIDNNCTGTDTVIPGILIKPCYAFTFHVHKFVSFLPLGFSG